MKKLYTIIAALFITGMFLNAQDVVLVNSNLSDFNPEMANNTTGSAANSYAITGGVFVFAGARYNDTSNMPSISPTTGSSEAVPATDNVTINPNVNTGTSSTHTVRFVRVGTNSTMVNNLPTTHFYQITPTNPFKDGGKITLVVSSNAKGGSVNIYNMTDGVKLGYIDISGLNWHLYNTVTFSLPSDLNGVKTIGFNRGSSTGDPAAGITFFTWNIKIETFGTSTSITQPNVKANLTATEYYNITGSKMGNDFNALPTGLYIVKKTYDNGQVTTEKISKAKR